MCLVHLQLPGLKVIRSKIVKFINSRLKRVSQASSFIRFLHSSPRRNWMMFWLYVSNRIHPHTHTAHFCAEPTLEHRHQLSSVVDCFGKFSDINGSVLIFHIHTRVRFCGLNFHFHYCWRWVFPQNRNGVFTILMRWNTNSSVHFPAVNGTWMELTLVFFYLTGPSQLWVTVRLHRVNFFSLIQWSLTVFTFFKNFRTSRKQLFWHTRHM